MGGFIGPEGRRPGCAPRTARWLALAILASALGAVQPAVSAGATTAEPLYLVTGGGWGHGLGMSQWGAKGYADKGWPAARIIQHFYSGTTVAKSTLPGSVRVGIGQNLRTVTLVPSGDVAFKAGSATVATAHAGETWRIQPLSNGTYRLSRNGTVVVSSAGSTTAHLIASWNSAGGVTVRVSETARTYRWGPLELNTVSTSGGYVMRAILVISPFDRYLYGLGEVPSSWPVEALKAQVIAARTYAVEKIGRLGQHRTGCNCAVYATTSDQAYVGYAKETGSYGSRWTSAVDSVAGVLALYNGAPIQAYYSSSDGGTTENNENVWGGSAIPYLRGVSDVGDTASPDHTWSKTFTHSQLQSILNSSGDTAVTSLYSIETLPPYGVSGRVLWPVDETRGGVRITGSAGVKRVSGDRIRALLGLKSTLFRIQRIASLPDGPVSASRAGLHVLRDGKRLRVFTSRVLASWMPSSEIMRTDPVMVTGFEEATVPFRDGAVLRDPAGTLWFVSAGKRRQFSGPEQMASMGYPTTLIVDVLATDLDLVPQGDPMDPEAPRPDGTFFRDSDTNFFAIAGGKRFRVRNEALPTWRLAWSFSIPATPELLATYPDGGELGFRDGAVLRAGDASVWLVSGGKRRHFASREAFLGSGFDWSMIRDVPADVLATIPEGSAVGASAPPPEGLLVRSPDDPWANVWLVTNGVRVWVPKQVLPTLTLTNPVVPYPAQLIARVPTRDAVPYRDGTLLGTPSRSVYLVSGGRLRPFASAKDFDAMKLSWSAIRWVTWLEVGYHAGGPAFNARSVAPDGALVRDGASLWVVRDGKRRPVPGGPTGPVAASHAFASGEAMVMNAATAALPVGAPIGFRDGTLLKEEGKASIYLISDGLRRGFSSSTIFNVLGFQWSNVRTVPSSYVSLHPPGPSI